MKRFGFTTNTAILGMFLNMFFAAYLTRPLLAAATVSPPSTKQGDVKPSKAKAKVKDGTAAQDARATALRDPQQQAERYAHEQARRLEDCEQTGGRWEYGGTGFVHGC